MKAIVLITAHWFFGLWIGLQEPGLNCGGDIAITVTDVFFRKEQVNPAQSICVFNQTDEVMQISDTDGEDVLAVYSLQPNGEQFLPANSLLDNREILIQLPE